MTDSIHSLPLLAEARTSRGIAVTPEVTALLAANAPVAIGVSGGKDSSAVALATVAYLDKIGHTGPRILIHADLGATEWADSIRVCRRLAERLGLELVIVCRKQGDMMDRWEQRWSDNVERWEALSCVKVILPWSTPEMRFCTAELKIDQITRYLCQRFPGQTILSVTGIRHAESAARAKMPTAQAQPKLTSITHKTSGLNWNPIIEWSTPDVYEYAEEQKFPLHEAYTKYGASRVSCIWCILATQADHEAGMLPTEHHALGQRMAGLEIRSTFGFQGSRWLCDTIAKILPSDLRGEVTKAKARGKSREEAEKRIPDHLLYTAGWPTVMPTRDEGILLAEVRNVTAELLGLKPTFNKVDDVLDRYRELLTEKARRDAEKEAKAARKAAKLN